MYNEEEPYEPEMHFEVHDGVEVAAPVLLKREKTNRYGSVPGLSDEELMNPDELERQVYREELGPVMMLPQPKCRNFNPGWDWSVDVDFDAFASADFDRTQPEFDKYRYKSGKLREQLKDSVIMMRIVWERIPGKAKYTVLKLVKMGKIDIGQIRDFDLYIVAEMYLRARWLRQQVDELQEKSQAKKAEQLQDWFDHLDRLPEPG